MRPRTENVPLQPEYGLNFAPSIMTATFSAWRYFSNVKNEDILYGESFTN